MTALRNASLAIVLAGLVACSGNVDLSCDDEQLYQLAVEGKRVVAPDDLDNLDPLRETPLPQAAPRDARPAGSDCIDRPPQVQLGGA